MALPLSRQLSLNDIRVELGIPSQTPFSLASASLGLYVTINQSSPSKPNSSAPFTVSSWYGYDHNAGSGGFNKVWLYNSQNNTYTDYTTPASNETTNDTPGPYHYQVIP